MEVSELIRWPDVARLLGVSTREVLDVINSGALDHPERGDDGDMYVRRSAVEASLRERPR